MSTINLELSVDDVNTVLEGLGRVQANAARIAQTIRNAAQAQFEAQTVAEKAKSEAEKPVEEAAADQATETPA